MSDPFRIIQFGPRHGQSNGSPVLIEVAHGATTMLQYARTLGLLRGLYPTSLLDFFLVNTDQGAPELAMEIGRQIVDAHPGRSVTIMIAEVPRTFIDFNRIPGVTAEAAKAGGVTPGLQPWVTNPDDVKLLTGFHRAYHAKLGPIVDQVCEAGGTMLALHTYAPRSVDVEAIDERIGERMREAWSGNVERWPLRPEIDLIGRDKWEGDDRPWMVVPAVLTRLRAEFLPLELEVADSVSYHLADVTMARQYRDRYPEQVICLEVRRDLLTGWWLPFAQMIPDSFRIRRIGEALAHALFLF